MIKQFQEFQIKQYLVNEYDEEDWKFPFINFEDNWKEHDRFNQDQVYENLTDEEMEMEWRNSRGE